VLFHVQLDGSTRIVDLEGFEDLVRTGELGPETPVRVTRRGAPEGSAEAGWVAAGTLPAFREVLAGPQVAVRRAWTDPPVPWMTALIVGLCVRAFLWLPMKEDAAHVFKSLTKWAPAILEKGEVWRLLTAAFLHGDLMHLFGNMVFLAYAGVALETLFGWRGVLSLFFFSVFAGSVLSGSFSNEPSVGASGADYGFLAAAVIVGWRLHAVLPTRARPRFGPLALVFLAWQLVMGSFNERIDNLAHLGGAIAGVIFGALALPEAVEAWRPRARRVYGVLLAVVAVGTVAAAWLPVPMAPAQADGLHTIRPASWREGVVPSGDFGWVSPLGHASMIATTSRGAPGRDAGGAVDRYLSPWRDAGPVEEAPRRPRDGGVAFSARAGDEHIEGVAFARGVYTHLVAFSWTGDNARLSGLADRVLDATTLVPVEAEAEVADAGDGAVGLVARARVEADVGRADEARALLARARAADPEGKAPVVAELEVATLAGQPDAPALAEAALARFPDDTDVVEAAADAFVAAGRRDRAREAVDAALVRRPTSRRLARLRDRLVD
jgi:membrane associated rhomboid family serine protease